MAAVEEIFPAVRRPPETYRGAEFQTQPRVTCGRTSLGYPLQKQVEEGIISVWCRFPCCAEWVVTRTGPLGAPTPGGLPLYVSNFHCTPFRRKLQEAFRKNRAAGRACSLGAAGLPGRTDGPSPFRGTPRGRADTRSRPWGEEPPPDGISQVPP